MSHVTAVSWSMQAGRMPTATISFIDVEIMADAEDIETWTEGSGPLAQELRAVDMAVLDLKPGDTIVLRSEKMLDQQQYDTIKTLVAAEFPGHRVVVLDGGLELSLLRATDQERET